MNRLKYKISLITLIIITVTVQPVYAEWYTEFLETFWQYLVDVFKSALEIIFSIISWVFYVIFDGLLTVVYAFFQGLDLSAVAFDQAAAWTQIPEQLVWLVNQLALPQCITIIIGAMGIRLLLNLIPAALTRV